MQLLYSISINVAVAGTAVFHPFLSSPFNIEHPLHEICHVHASYVLHPSPSPRAKFCMVRFTPDSQLILCVTYFYY